MRSRGAPRPRGDEDEAPQTLTLRHVPLQMKVGEPARLAGSDLDMAPAQPEEADAVTLG